jgi:hypothetical protein
MADVRSDGCGVVLLLFLDRSLDYKRIRVSFDDFKAFCIKLITLWFILFEDDIKVLNLEFWVVSYLLNHIALPTLVESLDNDLAGALFQVSLAVLLDLYYQRKSFQNSMLHFLVYLLAKLFNSRNIPA